MMVANSANLIITVKPASQKNNISKNYKKHDITDHYGDVSIFTYYFTTSQFSFFPSNRQLVGMLPIRRMLMLKLHIFLG